MKEQQRNALIQVSLRPDEAYAIKMRAQDDKRTVSAYVREVIVTHLRNLMDTQPTELEQELPVQPIESEEDKKRWKEIVDLIVSSTFEIRQLSGGLKSLTEKVAILEERK